MTVAITWLSRSNTVRMYIANVDSSDYWEKLGIWSVRPNIEEAIVSDV